MTTYYKAFVQQYAINFQLSFIFFHSFEHCIEGVQIIGIDFNPVTMESKLTWK